MFSLVVSRLNSSIMFNFIPLNTDNGRHISILRKLPSDYLQTPQIGYAIILQADDLLFVENENL